MKRLVMALTASIVSIAGLMGCGQANATQLLKSNLSRATPPPLSQSATATIVNGNSSFAVNLYKELAKKEGNLFFSPYSISQALAMTYAGAKNDTATQMATTLHFQTDDPALNTSFNALGLELASRGQSIKEGFRLSVVNALWGQKDYKFLSTYLDTLAVNYDAGLRTLDFVKAPEDSRRTINNWVSQQTEDRIKDLLPAGSITDMTRLVLTNAIYFKAGWKSKFRLEDTHDGPFNLVNDTKVTTPMMEQTANFGYYSGNKFQAVELKYVGDQTSMVILLPDIGTFNAFEQSLDLNTIIQILTGIKEGRIQLKMPKFKNASDFGLKDTLSIMGMPLAFTPGAADFSGINGNKDLYISDVVHKAYVSVDENGTEAAAATGVVIGITSMPPNVTVDRPFIYLIRDIKSNTILFLGRVMNPNN